MERAGTAAWAGGAPTSARRGGVAARFQPLLFTGGALTVLPALLAFDRPRWSVVLASALGAWGVLVWLVARRWPLSRPTLDLVAAGQTAAGLTALLTIALVDGRDHPEAYLLLAASFVCGLASIPRRRWRAPAQVVAIALLVLGFAALGFAPLDLVFVGVVFGAIAGISWLFVGELHRERAAARTARRRAERRAELLAAVQALPTDRFAPGSAVERLLELGFDAAGVALVDGDLMVPVHLAGLPDFAPPRGAGLAWRSVEQDRTIVVDDYQRDPNRLPERPTVRAAVVTPVRVDGRPVGSLMCARWEPTTPSSTEIEVAEVVAAHLSGVLGTVERERHQAELLERFQRLEQMRGGFVAAVSSELRDPLTVVRTVCQGLARHDELVPERRDELLDRLNQRAADLRRTIDAILDFSRFQSERSTPAVTVVELHEVLEPLTTAIGARVEDPDTVAERQVDADADLLRHALELLVLAGARGDETSPPVLRLEEADGEPRLGLRRGGRPTSVVSALATQLLVAGGAVPDAEVRPDEVVAVRFPVRDSAVATR